MQQRSPRERNKAFLAALHLLPCVTCQSRHDVEAAHIRMHSEEWTRRTGVRTGAGGAERPSDRWCLPVCAYCHRTGPKAEHVVGTQEFWRQHELDPHWIANELFQAFPNVPAMMTVMMRVHAFGAGRVACSETSG